MGLPGLVTFDQVLDALASPKRSKSTSPAPPAMVDPPQGCVLIATAELEQLHADAAAGAQAALAARDWAIFGAMSEGRLTPFQARSIATMWARDAEGAKELLATLPPNTIPVTELGHMITEKLDGTANTAPADAVDQVLQHRG